MDDQRCAAIAEDRVTAVILPIHIFRKDLRLRHAIRAHGNVLYVAGMVTFRILKAVLLAFGIEMRASGFEIWRIAFCVLVNVDCVFSRRQIMQVELDYHPLTLVQESRPNALAIGIFQFNSNFGCARY